MGKRKSETPHVVSYQEKKDYHATTSTHRRPTR